MKKLVSLLLAFAMVFCFIACANEDGTSSATESNSEVSSATGDNSEAPSAPEDNSETGETDSSEWPVIRQEVVSLDGNFSRLEVVNAALNDYLISIDAGVLCEMIPMSMAERGTKLTLMLTDPENGIDLFCWRFYSTTMDLVKNDQIISLEKYKEIYPELWEMFPEAVYKTADVNNEAYCLPAAGSFGTYLVYVMREDVCKEIGAENLIGTRLTDEQFEDLLKKAEDLYPELQFIPGADNPALMNIDTFGLTPSLGVLLNRGTGDDADTIVNWYASNEFHAFCERTKIWANNGYFINDPLNNEIGDPALTGGTIFDAASLKAAKSIQEGQTPDYKYCAFELGDWVGTNSTVSNGFCISSVCQNPDAAMKLLNLEMTDENVLRFFSLGVEGVTYKVLDNGSAVYADGVTAADAGWNLGAAWMFPNEFLSIPFNTDYVDQYAEAMACWDYPAEYFSKGMGFVFDPTNVYEDYLACTAIVDEYKRALVFGQVSDIDSTLKKFNSELEENGVNEIIAEMQAQYDVFLGK